jgi:hypothetical protein
MPAAVPSSSEKWSNIMCSADYPFEALEEEPQPSECGDCSGRQKQDLPRAGMHVSKMRAGRFSFNQKTYLTFMRNQVEYDPRQQKDRPKAVPLSLSQSDQALAPELTPLRTFRLESAVVQPSGEPKDPEEQK